MTNPKPDFVILDNNKKKVHIFEITVPLTVNIEQRNLEKYLKYAPFTTDMTGYDCSVNCFEVSSTGFINKRNKSTLSTLHTFIRKDLKKPTFLQNLHALSWYGSYKLWLSREDAEFPDPPFLLPHIDISPSHHTMIETGSQEAVEGRRGGLNRGTGE